MSDINKMRERLDNYVTVSEDNVPVVYPQDALAFGKAERALAVQELLARASDGAAPEFAEAERQLRMRAEIQDEVPLTGTAWAKAIAVELDRLRALVASQAAEMDGLRAESAFRYNALADIRDVAGGVLATDAIIDLVSATSLSRAVVRATRCLDGADESPKCETCSGSGEIDLTLGGTPFSAPHAKCPDCDGTGEVVIAPSEPQPQSADRATRVVWVAGCKSFSTPEIAVDGVAQRSGRPTREEAEESSCKACTTTYLYRVTITAERVEGSASHE